MNITNCKSCGRLFNVINNSRLCPECLKALEDKFQDVKKYLDEKPNATIEAVSQDNEVSVKQIKQWVREERLIFAEGSSVTIECENCGKQIRTGRFCDMCKAKMTNNLMSALDRPKQAERPTSHDKDRDRMRFL